MFDSEYRRRAMKLWEQEQQTATQELHDDWTRFVHRWSQTVHRIQIALLRKRHH